LFNRSFREARLAEWRDGGWLERVFILFEAGVSTLVRCRCSGAASLDPLYLIQIADMARAESWGEWGRKAFEAAFIWLLVALLLGFVAGGLLGEASGYFMLYYVTPACVAAYLVHLALLWCRARPIGKE